MRTKNSILFSAVISILFSINVSAQLTAVEANALMSRGINIGNTLECPTEGSWGNGPIQEYYFDDYKAAGFKNVRIPVKWDTHTAAVSPYTVDVTYMNRVEQVVDWGLERGLIITINAHHEEWIKEDYSNPLLRARFDSIWSQVATRFKDKSENLFFEIINEPKGLTQNEINDLNARIIPLIRKTNPTRIIIYSGHEWSGADQLMSAAIPDDDYLLGYYHSYDPWNFAGEAIGTWGTPAEYSSLEARFAQIDNWSKTNGIPVTISEFGAVGDYNGSGTFVVNDYNSRARFYAAYTEKSLSHNISFSVWDDGGWFNMYQRKSRKWNDLKDIVIYTTNESPTEFSADVYSDTLVQLTWKNRHADCDSISIERKRSLTAAFSKLSVVSGDVSSYVDTNVLNNNYYFYRIIVHLKDGSVIHSCPYRIYFQRTYSGPYNGIVATIPGVVEAENYDLGGAGKAYYDSDETNLPGAYRADEGVDIEARPEGGFQLTGVVSGEWLDYTIDVTIPGNYLINFYVAAERDNGVFYLQFANGKTTNIRVTSTGSMIDLTSESKYFNLNAGKQLMRLFVLGNYAFSLDKIEFISEPNYIENAKNPSLILFPNPTTDNFQISSNKGSISSITIYNTFGQKLYESFPQAEYLNISIENFGAGLYFVEAEIDRVKYYNPLIIKK